MNCEICDKGPICKGERNVARVKTKKGRDTINRASIIQNLAHVIVDTGALVYDTDPDT